MFEKFDGIGATCLQIENTLQPFVGVDGGLVKFVVAGFICPVAGDAAFGDRIHITGADLYFNRQAVGAGEGGMQALIAVTFRDGDVIFDFAGLGFVEIVQCTERGITGGDAVHNHAEAVNIHDFGETQVFGLHFLINAVQIFFAAFDLRFDIGADQTLAEGA